MSLDAIYIISVVSKFIGFEQNYESKGELGIMRLDAKRGGWIPLVSKEYTM